MPRLLWYLRLANWPSAPVGPFVFPRSFFTPSVMLGILMKWYSLNHPTSFLMKWLAIKMIASRLSFKVSGVSEVRISVGTLFSFTSEIGAKFLGHILWENVRWVDGRVTVVRHTQIFLLFCGSVNLYSTTRLLLPLMAGRVFLVRFGCCRIMLASVTLFGHESGVRSGMRCTIPREFLSSFLSLLAWVLFQGLTL